MTKILPKGDVFNHLPASFRALAEFAEKRGKEADISLESSQAK